MTQEPKEELKEKEEDLWQRVVRNVRKNPRRREERQERQKEQEARESIQKEKVEEEKTKKAKEEETKKAKEEETKKARGEASRFVAGEKEKIQGGGLDRRSARRLRRGEMAIEDRIDLHGLTRLEARGALCMGLRRCYDQGLRCVLVISGKGRGVVREEVMSVLDSVEVRDIVVEHDEAQTKDGGGGARYVLLRRRRK